jgi:hypothetical protein
MNNVIKFPLTVSRRAHARKPRTSINGTPEERAAQTDSERGQDDDGLRQLVKAVVDEEKLVGDADDFLDNRPSGKSLSITAANGRLRTERHEAWRMAEAATRYWRMRLDFEGAVSYAQRMEIIEGSFHPAVDEGCHMPMVEKYRAALVRQFLTPAWDVASVAWKQNALARGKYQYTGLKPERLERAISDDLAFLAAHPVRQSRRDGAVQS